MADKPNKPINYPALLALAILLVMAWLGMRSRTPYPPPPDFHPPDFTRFDFQKQLDLAKALEHLPPVPVDASAPQGLASGMIFLEPAHDSEAGVHATLDTTGEIPRLHVSNDSQPRAFLAGVSVKLSCLGVPERTLAVGSLAFDKTVVVDTASDIKSCPRAPLFEAQAKNRWEATARAADEVARKILQSSDRPPEGALDYLSSQFTSAGGRVLLLLAARGSAEARHALVVAYPSSRRFLLEALPAISDPATPLYAMLALPDRGAPVLRLSPELRLRGLDDALLLAVERDHKLPRDAYLPAAKRPGLLEVVEARERFQKLDESEAANRQQAARAAVAEALATFSDDAAAAALVHDLVLRESDKEARPLVEALRSMPRAGALAAAHVLGSPTGAERFFAHPALVAELPELIGLIGEEEAKRRYDQARREQAELTWASAQERAWAGDWDGWLPLAKKAIAQGYSAKGVERTALLASQALAYKGNFAAALRMLDEARQPGADAEKVRREYEEQILDGMFARGVAREGPGPEFRAFALGSERAAQQEAVRGWTLATFGTQVGFLPPGTHYRGVEDADEIAIAPSQILERLERLEEEGLHPRNALSVRARAYFAMAVGPVIACFAVLAVICLLAFLAWPAQAGRFFFALGQERIGILLGRWGFARHPLIAAIPLARMLVRRAEARPKEKRVRLAAAAEAVEIFGLEREGRVLAGHIALLRGERERAFQLQTASLEGSTARWAKKIAQYDLARIALSEERYDDAALHGERSGGARGALLSGAAWLAAGSPRVAPLLRASVSGKTRVAALSLLAHALLEKDHLRLARLALALAPRRGVRAVYARARLAHALGHEAEAKSLYAELAKVRTGHGGAKLGQALLSKTAGALEELAFGEGDASGAARSLLARRDLAAGEARRAAERLRLPRAGAPVDLELLGIIAAARGRLLEAHQAFRQAASRSGRHADAALAESRSWALAARALTNGNHGEALEILKPNGDPALVAAARAGAIASLLRKEPQTGISEAARRVLGVDLRADQPDPLPLSLAAAARALYRGELEAASRDLWARLAESEDAVTRFYMELVEAALARKDSQADLDALASAAVAARPSFAAPAAVLLAAAHLAAGREEKARQSLVPATKENVEGPAAVHAARLASHLGVAFAGPLLRPFEEARQARSLEAGRLLDAFDGERCPALVRARAAMARGAAMARVEVADFPGAAAELQGLWSFAHDDDGAEGALKAARVDTDAVRDALAELSLDAFPRLATTEPQRALRLLEQARHMPHDLEPRVVHDRAVAALGACLAEGDHPRAALITSLGRAIDQLFADHAALAHFRLRRLELAGASPPPPGDFEAEARAQAVETVAAYLAYLLERGQGARVRQAIEPWQGEARSGSFGDGLRRAADAVRAELHEALGLMDGKLASVRRAVEAVAVWEALDARLSLLLARLRDLRAEPSMVDACEDAAARCLDGFSVHVFNTVARGPLPLQIIERALGLAHANHLREHLLANRSLMGGAS